MEGKLYLPDSYLQLSEINETISAICTGAIQVLRTAYFSMHHVHNVLFSIIIIIIIITTDRETQEKVVWGTKNQSIKSIIFILGNVITRTIAQSSMNC